MKGMFSFLQLAHYKNNDWLKFTTSAGYKKAPAIINYRGIV